VTNQLRTESGFAVNLGTRVLVPLGVFERDPLNLDMIGIAFRVGDDVKAVRLVLQPVLLSASDRRNADAPS